MPRKVARTIAVVGLVGTIGSVGAFSAFSSQTSSDGNVVTAGSVTLADNDAGAAVYSLTNARPGASATSCIRVSYGGSLDADVKLYTPSTIGPLGPHVTLKIEPGTQASSTFPSCTGFTADGAAIYDGALSAFPTSYTGGVVDNPGSTSKWVNGDAVVYRITATLASGAPDSAQGATTGSHVIRWEARNQ
jgi:predicted ribosomally synthesized peptide with SipW-like signal peptide